MHRFDESQLVAELETLPAQKRVAFAAAVATRQLSGYERFARRTSRSDGARPREIASELWDDLDANAVDKDRWSMRLDEVMSLLPEEGDEWVLEHAFAEDALSSLAYAIRCLLNAQSQEAAWAARCAYEAADQAAIRSLDIQPGRSESEESIMSHAFIQRELERQKNDIYLLGVDAVSDVQHRAFEDELLTEQEVAELN